MWENSSHVNKNKVDILIEDIENKYNFSNAQLQEIKRKLTDIFLADYNRRWKKVDRKKESFIKNNESFLQKNFTVTIRSNF